LLVLSPELRPQLLDLGFLTGHLVVVQARRIDPAGLPEQIRRVNWMLWDYANPGGSTGRLLAAMRIDTGGWQRHEGISQLPASSIARTVSLDQSKEERAELAQLRRENRRLREDVEILKRATAFFVKETR
jgi:hypothetical protein